MKSKRLFTSASILRANNSLKTKGLTLSANGSATDRNLSIKSTTEIRNAFRKAIKKIA